METTRIERFLWTVRSLWWREMVRFYRQPSRVAGALGSPLIFWLLIGSGIGTSYRSGAGGGSYLEYFFPGTLLLILLFTSIFSTISLIEDRREGFFQSVLVAPVPRSAIVLGKVLGGATLALSQGILFLLFSPWAGIHLDFMHWLVVLVIIFINAFSLSGLGFLIAWRFRSIQGFHAVMNLFLIPMWLLSGALFSSAGAFGWVRMLMTWNPLTYEMRALRLALTPELESGSLAGSAAIALAFGLCMLVFSAIAANRPQEGE